MGSQRVGHDQLTNTHTVTFLFVTIGRGYYWHLMYKDKGTTRTKDYPVQNVNKVKIEKYILILSPF